MRFFIKTQTGENIPVEAKNFDTIGYVKGLIMERKGFCLLDQRFIFEARGLDDSKTLADYYIQNESVIHMIINVPGAMRLHIKPASLGKPFTIALGTHDPTINDVKAEIEDAQGIPVNEQSLFFYGKKLDVGARTLQDYGIPCWSPRGLSTLRLVRLRDAGNVVDIAAVKAHKKAALLKGQGSENQAEAKSELPEVGSRRAREDYPSNGAHHEEDFGLNWRKSRSLISLYDTSRFESKSHGTLIESVANDCVRTLNVTASLEKQLKEYKDELSKAESELKGLTERNGHLEDSWHKEKDTFKKLVQELDRECSTGASFLQYEIGRRHMATLERQAAKCAVDGFKKSRAIDMLVKDRAMSVYEDTLKECQNLLRKSGCVSEDIIQSIGPQNEETEEDDFEIKPCRN